MTDALDGPNWVHAYAPEVKAQIASLEADVKRLREINELYAKQRDQAEADRATLRSALSDARATAEVHAVALAAAQAREVALREAVASLDPCGGYNNHQWVNGEPCRTCGWTLEAAAKLCDALDSPSSATPLSDTSALRAFGLKVARATDPHRAAGGNYEAIVDAVLGGAP